MKKNILLAPKALLIVVFAALTLLSLFSQAKEVCGKSTCEKPKRALFFLGDSKSRIVKGMSQYQAENLCCMENGLTSQQCAQLSSFEKFRLDVRLITAREMVIEATRTGLGLQVMELSPEQSGQPLEGFNFFRVKNPDGTIDQFYYRHNFQEHVKIWSASLHPFGTLQSAFLLDNYSGGFGFRAKGIDAAVVCSKAWSRPNVSLN